MTSRSSSLIVLGQGGGFIGYKTEPAIHLQRYVHGHQTTLVMHGTVAATRRCNHMAAAARGRAQLTAGPPIHTQIGV